MRKQLSFILLILSITTFSFTQQQDRSDSLSDIKHIIQGEFESQYGQGWQFSWNLNSTPHRIFGGEIAQHFNASDPIESEYAAREFISANQVIYNLPEDNLDLWVNEQHGSLRYLIFNQVYQNISVWNARIDFRYRLNGDLVMTGMDAYPNLSVDVNPSINLTQSISFAKDNVDSTKI